MSGMDEAAWQAGNGKLAGRLKHKNTTIYHTKSMRKQKQYGSQKVSTSGVKQQSGDEWLESWGRSTAG